MFPPDFSRLLGDAAVELQILLGYGQHISINVFHVKSPWMISFIHEPAIPMVRRIWFSVGSKLASAETRRGVSRPDLSSPEYQSDQAGRARWCAIVAG
jgi:hypothetical protein